MSCLPPPPYTLTKPAKRSCLLLHAQYVTRMPPKFPYGRLHTHRQDTCTPTSSSSTPTMKKSEA